MKERNISKHVLRMLIIVFAILFCVSAYALLDYYLKGKQAEDSYNTLRNVVNEKEDTDSYASMQEALLQLHDQNGDLVGWLNVFGTGIDYPVMQTPDDPEFYLRKNFDKKYSLAGSLFLLPITDVAKPSDITTIYGHHMKNGKMFGPLMDYRKKSYYKAHRYLRFDTLEERRVYEITNVLKVSKSDYNNDDLKSGFAYHHLDDFADEADYNAFINAVNKRSLYETGVGTKFGDEFIILSTCEYSQEDGRLLVMAKRIPEDAVQITPDPEATG